ncbi:MAG: hypothetical protein GY811_01490 [Myxococcales bacterium]|nr:hypothetical protein [Myxococcales bacterium]
MLSTDHSIPIQARIWPLFGNQTEPSAIALFTIRNAEMEAVAEKDKATAARKKVQSQLDEVKRANAAKTRAEAVGAQAAQLAANAVKEAKKGRETIATRRGELTAALAKAEQEKAPAQIA